MLIPLGILAGGLFKRFLTWVNTIVGASTVVFGGTYANLTNGKYFAFGGGATGGNTTTYRYSVDGATWLDGTLPTSTIWGRAAASPTRLVVTRLASSNSYAHSTDGTTWTTGTILGSAAVMSDIIWDGTRFLGATRANTNNVTYSTNGTSWTQTTAVSQSLASIASDGTRQIATIRTVTSTYATTTSFPTGWTTGTFPATEQWGSVVTTGGKWAVFSDDDNGGDQITPYLTSNNGTTWTVQSLPTGYIFANSEIEAKAFADNGTFYYFTASAATNSRRIGYSSNLIDWSYIEPTNATTATFMRQWAVGPDLVVGLGSNTTTSPASRLPIGTR